MNGEYPYANAACSMLKRKHAPHTRRARPLSPPFHQCHRRAWRSVRSTDGTRSRVRAGPVRVPKDTSWNHSASTRSTTPLHRDASSLVQSPLTYHAQRGGCCTLNAPKLSQSSAPPAQQRSVGVPHLICAFRPAPRSLHRIVCSSFCKTRQCRRG